MRLRRFCATWRPRANAHAPRSAPEPSCATIPARRSWPTAPPRIEREAGLVAALQTAVVALDLILSLDGLVCICADDDGTDRADCALHGTVGAHAALAQAAAVGVTPKGT